YSTQNSVSAVSRKIDPENTDNSLYTISRDELVKNFEASKKHNEGLRDMSLLLYQILYLDLASALCTNHSLTELILNDNDLGDCGVKRLCKALKNPKCKVQKLWNWCDSVRSQAIFYIKLSTCINQNPLAMGYTTCVYSDPCYVSVSLIYRLDSNNLTADCTEDLASALSRNHSLTELILNDNELGDCGVKRMCGALRNPECKIQKLGRQDDVKNTILNVRIIIIINLSRSHMQKVGDFHINLELESNNLTADCTEDLTSALSTNYSLTDLILNDNNLGDCGVKRLCEALRNPECKLKSLQLGINNLRADCTDDLTSALSTNHSLTELILNRNNLGDCGVKRLCEALRNPECKIKSLQ
uniref:Uncharacterized protein n=1 Tax=Callorhinchus milii TaxID=7868 RepID=A0A4W3H348_CALMI